MPQPRSFRLGAAIPAAGILLLIYLFYIRSHIANPDVNISVREHFNDDEDPTVFEPPVASVRHSVIRGDNVAWTNDENATWYSISRHSNRGECWTYNDRFGAYQNLSPAMSAAISAAVSGNNNVNKSNRAVILRMGSNQQWGPQFTLHARALVLEAGYLAKYDVVILTHLDMDDGAKATWMQRVPEEFRPLVQTFSTKQVREWLPRAAKFKSIFDQNHLVIQMFMAQNPKYEFAYSVEADARLIGRWDVFLDDVDLEYAYHRKFKEPDQEMPAVPDLVTFESPRRPSDAWPWLEKDCVKHFRGMDNIRASLGVVWGWSRRMTDEMTRLNEIGVNCYYEYFAPSTAYRQNLTTFFYQHPLYCPHTKPSERNSMTKEQMGKNDPRGVQHEKVAVGCTYFFVNPHSQPFWEQWYRSPAACRPPALVHPVKGNFFN
ncbi:hypothetical protein Dda_7116 [Drechslerella dactyloides]|uniref:Uncharacterized protein n=1 Tax=Drechslerella dactyloides TaxID=74499 RepID=A0AAD6ITP6_DREDA|nr:hypothetical protein Dda_7116 [Drechslerella dactyloides]